MVEAATVAAAETGCGVDVDVRELYRAYRVSTSSTAYRLASRGAGGRGVPAVRPLDGRRRRHARLQRARPRVREPLLRHGADPHAGGVHRRRGRRGAVAAHGRADPRCGRCAALAGAGVRASTITGQTWKAGALHHLPDPAAHAGPRRAALAEEHLREEREHPRAERHVGRRRRAHDPRSQRPLDVPVEQSPGGPLSDHYDPRKRAVYLSEPVYHGRSISAAAVGAHEVGHAIQHAKAYKPMQFRSALWPAVSFASQGWMFLLLGGLFFQLTGLFLFAIILYGVVVLFQLVTLPVEFDASRRAGAQLASLGLVTDERARRREQGAHGRRDDLRRRRAGRDLAAALLPDALHEPQLAVAGYRAARRLRGLAPRLAHGRREAVGERLGGEAGDERVAAVERRRRAVREEAAERARAGRRAPGGSRRAARRRCAGTRGRRPPQRTGARSSARPMGSGRRAASTLDDASQAVRHAARGRRRAV